MARQMVLGFPVEVDYSPEAFMPLPGNQPLREALPHLAQTGRGQLLITGESGTGKTHALHMAAALCQGRVVPALAVDAACLSSSVVMIDDIETLTPAGQETLFHLLQRPDGLLVLASGLHPQRITGLLPDVTSRLRVMPQVTLAAFDDQTLELMTLKLAADAQLVIRPDVMAYLLQHAERSPAALATLVRQLDALSLQEKRAITLPLVRKALNDAV